MFSESVHKGQFDSCWSGSGPFDSVLAAQTGIIVAKNTDITATGTMNNLYNVLFTVFYYIFAAGRAIPL